MHRSGGRAGGRAEGGGMYVITIIEVRALRWTDGRTAAGALHACYLPARARVTRSCAAFRIPKRTN